MQICLLNLININYRIKKFYLYHVTQKIGVVEIFDSYLAISSFLIFNKGTSMILYDFYDVTEICK